MIPVNRFASDPNFEKYQTETGAFSSLFEHSFNNAVKVRQNLRFAHELEPGNRAIAEKLAHVERLRAEGQPTVPSTIAEEKATNPFLRWRSAELRASIRARFPDVDDDDVAIFAKTRQLKDAY